MKKILKSKKIKVIIFLSVLIFTFILRAHNFDRSPVMGNLEEMLYAWSGIYLVETGVPISWSTLEYPDRATFFNGTIAFQGGLPKAHVILRKPWLDEPPLFSYIVGYFGHIYKADKTDWIPTAYIRTPTVLIALLTSMMVFLIARFVSGFWTGILSMFIYGTVPIFVLGSRMAVPENLIALMFTIMIYLLLKFDRKTKFIYLLFIPILVGIAGLSKPTGFFLLPLALYFVFAKKMYRSCLYLILGSLPFIIFFFGYGIYFDSEIFWKITSLQSFRPVGFSSLAWFFTSPAYDWRMLLDSWYVFCLLVAAYFLFNVQVKAKKILFFCFIYWVLVVMISGGEGDLLAWYRYPLFPLLAIFGAWGLQLLYTRTSFFTTFLAIGLLLGNSHLLVNAFHPNVTPTAYRLILTGVLLPSIFYTIYHKAWLLKICKGLIVALIIIGFYFNIQFIYNEYEIACQGAECLFGPQTKLSTLHFPIIWRFFVID